MVIAEIILSFLTTNVSISIMLFMLQMNLIEMYACMYLIDQLSNIIIIQIYRFPDDVLLHFENFVFFFFLETPLWCSYLNKWQGCIFFNASLLYMWTLLYPVSLEKDIVKLIPYKIGVAGNLRVVQWHIAK